MKTLRNEVRGKQKTKTRATEMFSGRVKIRVCGDVRMNDPDDY